MSWWETIYNSVSDAVQATWGPVVWLFDTVIAWIGGFFSWLFDPATLLDFALRLLVMSFDLTASMLPEEMGNSVEAFADLIQSAPVGKAMSVALWLASPVASPEVVLAIMKFCAAMFFATLAVKGVMLVKGHIWSSSS